MKLSIFTTVTRPGSRGDNAEDAFKCYGELADELIIVNGNRGSIPAYRPEKKVVCSAWPKEFSWEFIGQQFQKGYEEATGDWVIHADVDFIFHEKDFDALRKVLEDNRQAPALSFYKHQFILPDRYNLKSRLVVAVNKRVFGDRIKFNSGGDLCQPSLDGKELKPDMVPEARIAIWNYEKLIKTKEQILNDVGRMCRAYQRYFGNYKLGGPDDQSAYEEWFEMVRGRFQKPQEKITLEVHPKFVQETIKNLKPEMWGYSGFGELEVNSYV